MKTNKNNPWVIRCVICALLSSMFAMVLLLPLPVFAGNDDADSAAYLKAKQYVLDGKFEKAAPLLEAAVKADPENPYLNHQLSEVYLRLNQFEKAEVLGKKAAELEPNNVEYRKSLGAIYATLKKYPEAKEQYTKISQLEPTNQSAPLLIGILEAESGNLEKGADVLTKAVSDNPENAMALFYRAKIYIEMEKIDLAKNDLDKCLTLRPAFVEAGTALGLIYEKTNQPDEAIKVYNRIQGSGTFTKRLAQLYLQKNDYEKALNTLLEYEKVEPDDYSARLKISLIYTELKKYKDAETRLVAILKEQPEADNVNFHLARVYEEQKQTDKALKAYKKVSKDAGIFYIESALRVGSIMRKKNQLKEGAEYSKKLMNTNPEVVEFYDMHASFLEAQKDFKGSLAVIEKALGKSPKDEKLLYFQGALYDKTGNRDGAIANMRKILEANPESPHAMNFLAFTWAETGENLDEAEKYARKAVELKPGDGFIEDTLGWVLFKKGKVEESLAILEKAATMQPDEAIIYDHLGDAYLKKQEYAKAQENFKKAQSFAKQDKDMARKIQQKIATLSKDKRVPSAEKN